MIRKAATLIASTMLALSLCACGGGSTQPATDEQPAEEATTEQTETVELEPDTEAEPEEYDPMVDTIDLSLDGGSIRFVRFEPANEGLVSSDEDTSNAMVFVFEFTNEQSVPSPCWSVFQIQFFQNGAELPDSVTYSSTGGEQYDLVGAFTSDAMKGGTITFGRIVLPKDDSPITIMVSPNGAAIEDNYQMMEVAIDGSEAASGGSADSEAATSPVDDIDAALQGSWTLTGEEFFTFDNGSVTLSVNGQDTSGTYEINVDESVIVSHLQATDGNVKASISYTYEDGVLKLYNNNGVEFTKQ